MAKPTYEMNIEDLTEMSIHHFKSFLKFIGEHDLWDAVEKHLQTQGCTKILISFEPIASIGQLLHQRKAAGDLIEKTNLLPLCACNAQHGPRPGPVTPPNPK
jgi:hypothetical protein